MTDYSDANAELEAARAEVPTVRCKGICTDACGPVDGGPLERQRMRRAGVKLPPHRRAVAEMVISDFNYCCPALVDGRCSTYEERPMICRTWGASEDMRCPYGCEVEGDLLTSAETLHLVDVGRCAGTIEQPRSVAWYQGVLDRNPAMRARIASYQPDATFKTPKGRETSP